MTFGRSELQSQTPWAFGSFHSTFTLPKKSVVPNQFDDASSDNGDKKEEGNNNNNNNNNDAHNPRMAAAAETMTGRKRKGTPSVDVDSHDNTRLFDTTTGLGVAMKWGDRPLEGPLAAWSPRQNNIKINTDDDFGNKLPTQHSVVRWPKQPTAFTAIGGPVVKGTATSGIEATAKSRQPAGAARVAAKVPLGAIRTLPETAGTPRTAHARRAAKKGKEGIAKAIETATTGTPNGEIVLMSGSVEESESLPEEQGTPVANLTEASDLSSRVSTTGHSSSETTIPLITVTGNTTIKEHTTQQNNSLIREHQDTTNGYGVTMKTRTPESGNNDRLELRTKGSKILAKTGSVVYDVVAIDSWDTPPLSRDGKDGVLAKTGVVAKTGSVGYNMVAIGPWDTLPLTRDVKDAHQRCVSANKTGSVVYDVVAIDSGESPPLSPDGKGAHQRRDGAAHLLCNSAAVTVTPLKTAGMSLLDLRRPTREDGTNAVTDTHGRHGGSGAVTPTSSTPPSPSADSIATTATTATNVATSPSQNKTITSSKESQGQTELSITSGSATGVPGRKKRPHRANGILCGVCDKKIEDVNLWCLIRETTGNIQTHIKEHAICMACHPPVRDKGHNDGYVKPPLPQQARNDYTYRLGSQHEYHQFSGQSAPPASRSSPTTERELKQRPQRTNGILCGRCDKKIDDVNLWGLFYKEVVQTHIQEHVICMACHPPAQWNKDGGTNYEEPPLPTGIRKGCSYQVCSPHEYFQYSPGDKKRLV